MQTSTRMRVVAGRYVTGRWAHIVFETCTCDCKTFWRKEDMILYESKSDMCMISSPSSQNFEF